PRRSPAPPARRARRCDALRPFAWTSSASGPASAGVASRRALREATRKLLAQRGDPGFAFDAGRRQRTEIASDEPAELAPSALREPVLGPRDDGQQEIESRSRALGPERLGRRGGDRELLHRGAQ